MWRGRVLLQRGRSGASLKTHALRALRDSPAAGENSAINFRAAGARAPKPLNSAARKRRCARDLGRGRFVFDMASEREYRSCLDMRVEIEQEEDGRWLTEIPELPGVMAYGSTREEAIARAKALALRVLADRLEHGEPVPELVEVFSVAA